ncbi:MAG: right-handed parallel beta-helix repeat-containing protein [Kiritimatiellae bacterium]|nr:right-handed parallel beta-helix repeat-containing protein [Kiritimatiellia bacterium]
MNKQMPVRSMWSAILILLAAGRLAGAATYYVDGPGGDGLAEGGTDAGRGTIEAPWLTIKHGLEQLKPGDTLWIRGGTYPEPVLNTIPSGTPAARVTVANHENEVVTITPDPNVQVDYIMWFLGDKSYITVRGLVLDGAKKIRDEVLSIMLTRSGKRPHHLRLENLVIKNGRQRGVQFQGDHCELVNTTIHHNGRNKHDHGIAMSTACSNLVENCEIFKNAGCGMHVYSRTGSGIGNVFRGNYVHDNKETGILLATGAENAAYNNVIVDEKNAVGLQGERTQFNNNTVCGGSRALGVSATLNAEIKNNILIGSVRVESGKDAKAANVNLVLDNNLTRGDPLFVNREAADYHLTAGSPAVDAGVAVARVTVDKDGIARPQGAAPDIGAYEFKAAR